MPISAVALFGSRARGDQTPESDLDLLMVTDAGSARHSCVGHVSMSFYAYAELAERAAAGDLFVYHVLHEGRPVYDPGNEFRRLKDGFRLRGSYAEEIAKAADLGWLLAMFAPDLEDLPIAARRATWCVRTILAARSAEAGHPVFGAAALRAFDPAPEVARLLAQKSAAGLADDAAGDLTQFLGRTGEANPVPSAARPDDFRPVFEAQGNFVGLHLLRSLRFGDPDRPYP